MAQIAFDKVHVCRNHFMVIDSTQTNYIPAKANIVHWSKPESGVGFDQLLLFARVDTDQFSYRIFNADGSEAEQCGNGACAVASLIHKRYQLNRAFLTTNKQSMLATINGQQAEIVINMPRVIKRVETQGIVFYVIDVDNPHAVVESTNLLPEETMPIILQSGYFPNGANISFISPITNQSLSATIYERGVGWTFACGSAALAIFACQSPKQPLNIEFLGGVLRVVPHEGKALLSGKANYVFSGLIDV